LTPQLVLIAELAAKILSAKNMLQNIKILQCNWQNEAVPTVLGNWQIELLFY